MFSARFSWLWGGPPGPRPTPSSASVCRAVAEPDQGVRSGRGRPPHSTQDTGRLLKKDRAGGTS
jgi:hypothetical protein